MVFTWVLSSLFFLYCIHFNVCFDVCSVDKLVVYVTIKVVFSDVFLFVLLLLLLSSLLLFILLLLSPLLLLFLLLLLSLLVLLSLLLCCFSSQHNRLGYLYKHMPVLFVEVVESVLLLDIIHDSLIVRAVVELMKAVLLAVSVMAVWSVVSLGAVLPVV